MTAMIGLLAVVLASARDGEILRVNVSKDTWVSGVGSEKNGNNGAAPRLKLKSIQEFSLIDIPVAETVPKVQGRVIRSVSLHLKSAGEPRLKRVSVGGIPSFIEGTGTSYEVQPGVSTFRHFTHPDVPWVRDSGDICDVLFGPEGALWGTADASPPDADGWQTIAVEPRVFASRLYGLCGGFVVFDDTGTEWTRNGEQFSRQLFPNRLVFSRDQNAASAPYFTVDLGAKDQEPPMAPTDLRIEPMTPDLPKGEAIVSWIVPVDRGGAGIVGFHLGNASRGSALNRVALAGKPGTRVRWHLREKDFADSKLSVRAIDAAGNLGPAASLAVAFSKRQPKAFPAKNAIQVGPNAPLPRLGATEVSVIDELDKIHPVTGRLIPNHDPGYLARNHLWNAQTRAVSLHAARGETIAFQVVIRGDFQNLPKSLVLDDLKNVDVAFGTYENVESKDGPLPDPIIPVEKAIFAPSQGHALKSIHVELHVHKDAKAGLHKGTLSLLSGKDRLELSILLRIWDFTLPDHLSFLPEMNCYGLPDNERDYYRLAHQHRTFLNRVPYSQRGDMSPGCAPVWNGKTLDWTAWDKRFGPLFDGSAFAGLPRAGTPIEGFYLPLHENWPTPIEGNYDGGYWADRAISEAHRKAFVEASRQIAEHVRSKGWNDTMFECFFNGKNDFKDKGWSRGSSPWLLDEPANFQDFWALRYFGQSFHEGINLAPAGKAKLMFRCDISRPQWQRDLLDDVLDLNIVGSAFREYRPMVLDRKERLGHVVIEYGSSNPIESSNIQPAAWCIDTWSLGGDGVLPWQTIGTSESWKTADELSLFYPGRNGGPPVPSARLKAYRRGQQDVEYLTLYAKITGEPRWAVGAGVRDALGVSGVKKGTAFAGGEDAGRIDYGALSPADLWALRTRIGEVLSKAHPAPNDSLVDWTTPRRAPGRLQDRVVPSPEK